MYHLTRLQAKFLSSTTPKNFQSNVSNKLTQLLFKYYFIRKINIFCQYKYTTTIRRKVK